MRETTSQMNFRFSSATVTGELLAAGADGHRHVGLGLLAEVHRPVPGLAAPRLLEGRLARAVLARADHAHAQARLGDLLAPVGVDQRDVGDLGRLAQQLQELDAAQLHVAGVHLRQRGVLQLLRHLAQVLLDARGRADRLLALQAGQRGGGLAVGEVQADAARHQQRQARPAT